MTSRALLRRAGGAIAIALLVAGLGGAARADEILLKNGDRVTGTIQHMTDGKLTVVTPWGGTVEVAWPEVEEIKTDRALPFVLSDDTRLVGKAAGADADGLLGVEGETMRGRIRLGSVTAINPPVKPVVEWDGYIRLGAVLTDGNTRTREANAGAQVQARADALRLTLRGAWNYGEDAKADELFKRNALGEIKLDVFVLDPLYVYANALFQSDRFQDLRLRSAFGGGLGFQWLDNETIDLFTEGGLSYVVDDRKDGEDTETLALRFAWNVNWALIADRVSFFHRGEIFPSVEDKDDFFLNTSTGFLFAITAGFFASAQVDYRYDNQPSEGFGRDDTSYILGVGYEF